MNQAEIQGKYDLFLKRQLWMLENSPMFKRSPQQLKQVMLNYPPFFMYRMLVQDLVGIIESYNFPTDAGIPADETTILVTMIVEPEWNPDKIMEAAQRHKDVPLGNLDMLVHRAVAQMMLRDKGRIERHVSQRN